MEVTLKLMGNDSKVEQTTAAVSFVVEVTGRMVE